MTPKRSVFLPGESYQDYLDALGKSGKSRAGFDAERLERNGHNSNATSEADAERAAIQNESSS